MSEILLLEEIAQESIKKGEGCLFGKRDFVKIGNGQFDFFFHFANCKPNKNFGQLNYRIAYVMPYLYPEQEDKAKVEMADISKTHPFLSDFALCERGSARRSFADGERRVKIGDFLGFFNAKKAEYGVEISEEDYLQIDDDRLRKYFKNYESVVKYLGKLRYEINKVVNQAADST